MTRARNIANPTQITIPLTVSANISSNATLSIGNTTVNSIITGVSVSVGNSTVNTSVTPTSLTTGNLTVSGNTTLGDASTDTILMTGAPSIGGAGLGMGMGFRNRIINGAMVIDQRNAGASVSTNGSYPVDRFQMALSAAIGSTFTAQQSSTAPTGFPNSFVWTVGTAGTATGTQGARFNQLIEGYNVADMGFGAAGASTFTLSFWVRSSVTGTYCVFFNNDALDRSYVAQYTISAANTWEQKTITVSGDTSGTWLKTNGTGLRVGWDLGDGSDRNTTAGAWASGFFTRTSSQTNFIGNAGATFYITGVQLEKGSTATSFDYRPYGTELQLCQRYYEKSFNIGTAPADGVASPDRKQGIPFFTTDIGYYGIFKVQKRANPTLVFYKGANAGTNGQWSYYNGSIWVTMSTGAPVVREYDFSVDFGVTGRTFGQALILDGNWVASIEL